MMLPTMREWSYLSHEERAPWGWPITSLEDYMRGFSVTKSWQKNAQQCGAMRCKEPAAYQVLSDCWDGQPSGMFIPLCQAHYNAAREAYKLDDVPGSVRGARSTHPVPTAPEEDAPIVSPELQAEIHAEEKDAGAALANTESFSIQSQEDLDFAADCLKQTKGQARRLKAKQNEITKPLNETLKRVRALFKPALAHYSDIEGKLKALIGDAAAREEADRVKAMAAAGEGNTAEALANIRHTTNVGGLNVRMVWDFEVEDKAKVPMRFMAVDEKAVREYLKNNKEAPEIDGIRFFKKPQTSSGSV